MTYYVTTLLHVGSTGTMSADVAEESIKQGEVATVGTFRTAAEVLMRFGLTKEEAEDRCQFASTGKLSHGREEEQQVHPCWGDL